MLEDEDGAPKSKIRLKREEEAFLEVQKMHRQNLGVILDVLRIPNPELVFSGGPVGKDQLADGMSTGDEKHDARRKRGWGGGVGLFGLDGGDSRLFTLRLVTHPVFELFVLLSIGVSSGLLAAETHVRVARFPNQDTLFYLSAGDCFISQLETVLSLSWRLFYLSAVDCLPIRSTVTRLTLFVYKKDVSQKRLANGTRVLRRRRRFHGFVHPGDVVEVVRVSALPKPGGVFTVKLQPPGRRGRRRESFDPDF